MHGLDLISGLLLGLVAYLGPPSAALLFAARRKRPTLLEIGIIVLAGMGAFFSFSALLSGVLPYGLAHASMAMVASTLACVWMTRTWDLGLSGSHPVGWAPLLLFIVISATVFGIGDCVSILFAQNWGVDDSAVLVASPMHLDPRRNANVALALLRGADTLFLPGSTLLYQVFWHHGAATLLAVLPESLSRYHQVAGIALATGWILGAAMLWAVALARPALLRWPLVAVVLAALMLMEGRLQGTELLQALSAHLDGSAPPIKDFFQYFSVKLLVLTAPQHALFALFFVGVMAARLQLPAARFWRCPPWALLIVFAVLASPVLAAIALPFYIIAELPRWLNAGVKEFFLKSADVLAAACAAFVFHFAVLRFPAHELFMRQSVAQIQYWDEQPLPWESAILAFTFANGVIGALFTLGAMACFVPATLRSIDRQARAWLLVTALSSILMFVFWNAVITDVEIRRHASMVTAVLAGLFVSVLAASLVAAAGPVRAVAVMGLICSAAAAGVLDYRWAELKTLADNSTVARDIRWSDYYAANAFLKNQRPNAAVLAASGEGIVLPIANEVATTIAPKLAILAHQKVSPEIAGFLNVNVNKGAFDPGEISATRVLELRRMGFDTAVWGPVEEHAWGFVGRRNLLDGAPMIGRFGEVAVFDLRAGQKSAWTADALAFFRDVQCEALARSDLRALGYRSIRENGRYLSIPPNSGRAANPASAPSLGKVLDFVESRGCMSDRSDLVVVRPQSAATAGLTNLSQARLARQSSTAGDERAHGADNAVDGNPSGLRPDRHPAIAHTQWQMQPWWEVDLGRQAHISQIEIRGEHEAFAGRLENVVVFVSKEPIPANHSALLLPRGGRLFFVPGTLFSGANLPIDAAGRFVRIQLTGSGHFVASEVKVLGIEMTARRK